MLRARASRNLRIRPDKIYTEFDKSAIEARHLPRLQFPTAARAVMIKAKREETRAFAANPGRRLHRQRAHHAVARRNVVDAKVLHPSIHRDPLRFGPSTGAGVTSDEPSKKTPLQEWKAPARP